MNYLFEILALAAGSIGLLPMKYMGYDPATVESWSFEMGSGPEDLIE